MSTEVYRKLAIARAKLRGQALKKSGKNKFAGYDYFELGDFLHPTLQIFDELGLIICGSNYSDVADWPACSTRAAIARGAARRAAVSWGSAPAPRWV